MRKSPRVGSKSSKESSADGPATGAGAKAEAHWAEEILGAPPPSRSHDATMVVRFKPLMSWRADVRSYLWAGTMLANDVSFDSAALPKRGYGFVIIGR
jgi:hypothetical protein